MAKKSFTLLITGFIFLVNFIAYAVAGKFVYIRDNKEQSFGFVPDIPALLNYIDFILNSETALYLIAASWTALACLYTFISIPCNWTSTLSSQFDFFITLISFCFQTALGVMSVCDTLLLQQNFTTLIGNQNQLTIQQQLIVTVGMLYFIGTLPIMGFLLYQKWSVLCRQIIQQDRFDMEVKMVQ